MAKKITYPKFITALNICKAYYLQITEHQVKVRNTIEDLERMDPSTGIEDLSMGVMAWNVAKRAIHQKFGNVIPSLYHLTQLSEEDIIQQRGAGQKTLCDIKNAVEMTGHKLKP